MTNEVRVDTTSNTSAERLKRVVAHIPFRLLRVVFGLVLLLLVVRSFDWRTFFSHFETINLFDVGMVLGISIINLFLSALRWRTLLRADGVDVPLMRLVYYYLVSLFFNNFLPPFVGADAVRMIAVTESKSPGVRIVSVLIERGTGMLALVLFGFIAILLNPSLHIYSNLSAIVILALVAVLLALFLLLVPEIWLPVVRLFTRLPRIQFLLNDVGLAGRSYRRQPRVLLITMGFSFLIQLLVVAAFQVRALAFDVNIGFGQTLLVAPAVTLLTLIPISPGGLGTQEVFFAFVYGLVGISSEVAIAMALLARSVDLVIGGIGGIVWVRNNRR